MSYSNPERIHYTLAAVTTTSAAATVATIKGPPGKAGRIAEILGYITTTHVLGHTVAPVPTRLRVGVSGTLEAMANWFVPAGTAPVVVQASNASGALKQDYRLPADTDVLVNTIENEGTAAAGVIVYTVVIDWF